MNRSLRISIADDERDTREYLKEILTVLGHDVVSVAKNGRELIEQYGSLQPDVVITDIKMPEIDGIDAVAEICREGPVPVILLSAFHDDALLERAEENHVLAYLVKPIKRDDLESAIRIAVRRFEEFDLLRKEAADLRQALTDRKVIERAKGILMDWTGMKEQDAFRRLQKLASAKNRKLIDMAQMIVTLDTSSGGFNLNDTPQGEFP